MKTIVFRTIGFVFALCLPHTCIPWVYSDVVVVVALAKCRDSLTKIVSVECQAIESDSFGRTSSLTFLQDKHWYRIDRADKGPFKVRDEVLPGVIASQAYNGKRYQFLNSGLLQLSDERTRSSLAVLPHLMAYDWLGLEFGASREQLLDEELWEEVKTRCSDELLIEEFEGEECAVIKLKHKGGRSGETRVFLAAKKGYFPVGFEGFADGKPTMKFKVKETQTIRVGDFSLPFPLITETVNYNPDGSVRKETKCNVGASTLKVNQPLKASRFTIVPLDPGTEFLDHNILNASVRAIPRNSSWRPLVIVSIGAVAALVFLVWVRSNAKK